MLIPEPKPVTSRYREVEPELWIKVMNKYETFV